MARSIDRAYEVSWRERRAPGRAGKFVATFVLAAGLSLAALMFVPALLGYERYVITSGSMAGELGTGSLVYDAKVPVEDLEVGDVITYAPPAAASVDGMITHRIVSATRDGQGRRVFVTKGDANAAPDPWQFTLDGETQARVAFDVPYVGYVFAALSVREVRLALVGLPALLIALAAFAGLLSDARSATAGGGKRVSAPVPVTEELPR